MPTRTALSVLLVATTVLIVAAIPPNAPIFSAELQLSPAASPDGDRYLPAVAYNSGHHEYLVVWHNKWSGGHRDIYARRVTTTGELKTWFAVSAGTNSRFAPAVAYNPNSDNYLVVWMYDPGDGVHYEVWGRTVAWNGASMGTPFLISSWANRAFWSPRVAYNSVRNEYMVIANGYDTLTSTPNDISFTRVSAAGATSGGAQVYQDPAHKPHQPALTYNIATDEYLVVWRHYYSASDFDIHGALVSWNGLIARSNFVLDSDGTDQGYPAVATNNQGRYLVIWEQNMGNWDIYGKEYDVNGDAVSAHYGIGYSADPDRYPAVVGRFGLADTTDYVAVWQRETSSGTEIRASRWGTGVDGYGPYPFQVASAAFWDNEAPAVAMEGPRYLIAYESDSTGDPSVYRHIYARVWSPEGMFLPLMRR